ncbi:hypothetical protein F4780DRAFT_287448 [Xylariomycetidae sp. FL0641]|nr:hypothetical protein F4780DRAFT_287448 [Xylariomycetidae sp. FL0641]
MPQSDSNPPSRLHDYELDSLEQDNNTQALMGDTRDCTASESGHQHEGPQLSATESFGLPEESGENKHSIYTRLGTFTIVLNLLAFVGLTISTILISWAWFGGEEDPNRRRLILGEYLDITVTLNSVIIRFAIGTQAATTISMLAALALESSTRHGVYLREAPAMSIARYAKTEPISALRLFWSGSSRKCNWLFAVVMVSACTSVLSQFTSTLLLKDLGIGPITDFSQVSSANTGFGMDTWLHNNMTTMLRQSLNYWASSPVGFASFAEWSSKPKVESYSTRDTGRNLRAFLPIVSQETRTSTTSYQGMADVFDTRVFCSRPDLGLDRDPGPYDSVSGIMVHGNFTEDMTKLVRLQPNRTSTFNFSTGSLSPGSFLFVQLDNAQGGMISSLDPMVNSTLIESLSYDSDNQTWTARTPFSELGNTPVSWPVELGHSFLFVYREDISVEELSETEPYFEYNVIGLDPDSQISNGVWLQYPRNETSETGGIKITVFPKLTQPSQALSKFPRASQSNNYCK